MSSIKTKALVLGTTNLTGAHKIISLYSPDYGLLRGVAHGVKGIKNPFGSALEPLTHINLIYRNNPNRELQTILASDIINSFPEIRNDLIPLTAALYMAELIQKLIPIEGTGQPEIYRLILKVISLISASPDIISIIRIFEVRLLDLIGYRPHVEKCLCCPKTKYGDGWGFSPSMGGVLCISCKAGCDDIHSISPGGIMFLKKALDIDLELIGRLRLMQLSRCEVERVIQNMIKQHLSSPIKSYPVLLSFLSKV